jgi:hypothetical protein
VQCGTADLHVCRQPDPRSRGNYTRRKITTSTIRNKAQARRKEDDGGRRGEGRVVFSVQYKTTKPRHSPHLESCALCLLCTHKHTSRVCNPPQLNLPSSLFGCRLSICVLFCLYRIYIGVGCFHRPVGVNNPLLEYNIFLQLCKIAST